MVLAPVPHLVVAAVPAFNPVLQSSKAVLNLVACCGVGVVASKVRVLDQAAVSALSRLVFNIFQPSLLFTNVVTTLANPTGGSRVSLLVLPIFAVLQILTAFVLAQGVVRAAGIAPNSEQGRELRICSTFANSGPLPLLFVDSLFRAHPDPTLRPRAVAYVSFYLLAWSPLFWTYGYNIVADNMSEALDKRENAGPRRRPTLQEIVASPRFKRIVNPPTLGCAFGALTGAVPFLRNLFVGEGAPLLSLFDAMRTMGSAYVPCVLLVLAGSLAEGLEGFDKSVLRRASAVMVQRFILMPLVAAGMVIGGRALGLLPFEPLLLFVLLMQGCMPSAQNSVLILQLEKRPQAAASMARLISTVYILSVLPIGLLLRTILSHVKL